MATIYIIARHFTQDSGSYAGMIEEFSKYASKRYDIKILCARLNKGLKQNEKLGYAEVIRFNIPKFKIPFVGMNQEYFFLGKEVKKYFKENPPDKKDLILANTRAAFGVQGFDYVVRMGQPAMTFLKNMEIAKDQVSIFSRAARQIHFRLQSILERKCISNAKGIIASSFESKEIILKAYDIEGKPYFIPHSGVKYDVLSKTKQSSKRKGKIMLFISAGDEKVRKGVHYLEKALPALFEKYPNMILLHIGEKISWDVEERYKKKIISTGKVKWSDMKKYYAKADLLVNCALNEWIPNVVFEAMAAGLPVLTSDIEGISEVISHKKDGFIYKRGDFNGIIEGAEYILDSASFKENASASLKGKAKKLDYNDFSRKLLRFMESVKDEKEESINLLKNE
jgi:glycosyltransferase involved in cell wall biosynthesis